MVKLEMPNDIQSDESVSETAEPCNFRLAFIRGALLLQEKWVLMIVFDLLEGPRSFSQLMRKGSINTTTLTQRLNLLEKAGVLKKTIHSTMPPRTSYELTESGLNLKPILDAITSWTDAYFPETAHSEACPHASKSDE